MQTFLDSKRWLCACPLKKGVRDCKSCMTSHRNSHCSMVISLRKQSFHFNEIDSEMNEKNIFTISIRKKFLSAFFNPKYKIKLFFSGSMVYEVI